MTEAPASVALVTGASRGIGRAAAIALAQTGSHIVAVARTIGALEELDDEIASLGGSASLVQMDMRDRPALANLANSIQERWGRLDVMIANAAILGTLTPTSHLDESVWDEVIDTNLSAIWRMIKTFDNLLQASPHGRAVIVTSSIARTPYPFWSAYAASKAGLEALTLSWAEEVKATNLKINLLDPGGIATSMYASAFPGADLKQMTQPEHIAPAFVKLAAPDCPHHGKILRPASLL